VTSLFGGLEMMMSLCSGGIIVMMSVCMYSLHTDLVRIAEALEAKDGDVAEVKCGAE